MQISICGSKLRPQIDIQWTGEIKLFQEGEIHAPMEGNEE